MSNVKDATVRAAKVNFSRFSGLLALFALAGLVLAIFLPDDDRANLGPAMALGGLSVFLAVLIASATFVKANVHFWHGITTVVILLNYVVFAYVQTRVSPAWLVSEDTSPLIRACHHLMLFSPAAFWLACGLYFQKIEDLLTPAVVLGVLHSGAVWWVMDDQTGMFRTITAAGSSVLILGFGYLIFFLSGTSLIRRVFSGEADSHLDRELVNAKTIHEALFPQPIRTNWFQFGFAYRPMQQIGGDFIFVHHEKRSGGGESDDANVFHMLVIDVTGHGISAALTVNRLHAELQQVFATHSHGCPSAVLKKLNTYIFHTMADLGLFATAVGVRADFTNRKMTIASAGHPHCYRFSNSALVAVPSDGPMLGILDDDSFYATPVSFDMQCGDQLVLITDGVIEATNREGNFFGEDNTQLTIERSCREIPATRTIHKRESALGSRIDDRLLNRADVRDPAGLIQRVMRQKMRDRPCGLADEVMLSVDEFTEANNQDDILIATLEITGDQ